MSTVRPSNNSHPQLPAGNQAEGDSRRDKTIWNAGDFETAHDVYPNFQPEAALLARETEARGS